MLRRSLIRGLAAPTLAALIPVNVRAQTEVASKGLGLMENAFPALYGAASDDIMGKAYVVPGGTLVAYASFGDPVGTVERTFSPGVSYEDAVLASASLMPSDAVAAGQYVSDADLVVDIYTREGLRGKFPDADDWTDADPGTFIVIYGAYNPALGNTQVTRMVLAIGNNP